MLRMIILCDNDFVDRASLINAKQVNFIANEVSIIVLSRSVINFKP